MRYIDLDGNPIDDGDVEAEPEVEKNDGSPIHYRRLARDAKPIEWVVEGVAPAGTLLLFAGRAKLGRKSMNAIQLAHCVANGLPWLGRTTYARPVIYVALEDGRARVSRRMKHFGFDHEDWEHAPFSVAFGLPGLAYAESLLSKSGELQIVVIIDPLAEVAAMRELDEIDSADMTNLLRPYREWAQATGALVIVIHHFRKAGDMMRGSSALEAACDGWCNFDPAGSDKDLLLLDWTLRDAPPTRIGARFVEEHGILRIEEAEVPEGTEPSGANGGRQGRGGKKGPKVSPEQMDAADKEAVLAYMRTPGRGQVSIESLHEGLRRYLVEQKRETISEARIKRAVLDLCMKGQGIRQTTGGAHVRFEVDPRSGLGGVEQNDG